MKRIIAVSMLFMVLISAGAQVDFRQILSGEEMDKIWAEAKAENKAVFVDIYATWCGPCKWMDANVFALEAAGEYMNSEFINVKMDGESDFGRVFAQESGLSAYPSLFVFNSERKLMNMLVGAKPWEELQSALVSTMEYFPVLEMLLTKYESDILKREEYPVFTKALREMGKSDYGSAVASNYQKEFIKGNKRNVEDLQVLAFYTEQETENWTRLVADLPKLKKALGEDIEVFIDHAVSASIELSVEENNLACIKNMVKLLPVLTEETELDPVALETRAFIYYYHYSSMIEELMAYIDDEYSTKRMGDHAWLFDAAASAVFLDPQNTPVAEKGLEWFKACIDLKETQEYYYHLALCQYFTDSPDKAVESLKKSLEFTDDKELIETTLSIIQQVQGELEALNP